MFAVSFRDNENVLKTDQVICALLCEHTKKNH